MCAGRRGWVDVSEQVDVSSPDGSVRIVAGLDGAVGVQVKGHERHDDASLARQVGHAARLALASLTDAERRQFGTTGEP